MAVFKAAASAPDRVFVAPSSGPVMTATQTGQSTEPETPLWPWLLGGVALAGGAYMLTAKGAAAVAAFGLPTYAPALVLGTAGAAAVVGVSRKPKGAARPGLTWVPQVGLYVPRFASAAPPDTALLDLFGYPNGDDYPAPYRLSDAEAIASIVLSYASETAPKMRQKYDQLTRRMQQIRGAALPPWRKVYAIINTVVLPAFAENLFWHWYRPKSGTKKARFNAILSWAALFYALPTTATVAASVSPNVRFSALPPNMSAYLSPSLALKNELNPLQMRRALYDVFWFMTEHTVSPEMKAAADSSIHDLYAVYPLSDPDVFLIEGNLKTVDEILWLGNARVEEAIGVDFDEGAAWAALVVKVVAAVVSAVAPLAGPAIGAAIGMAGNAIQAIAYAAASGEISPAQVQALGGAGVAFMLDQAAIRLGLDSEMNQVETLVGQVV